MPIQELVNFRTKYPQYGDLSDGDLAAKLAGKFPDAYSDLPSLVAKEVPEEKPSFRSEIMGPITHAISALAFDVPRTAMDMQINRGEPGAEQAKKFLYPEQQTLPGKMLRFGLEAPATAVGGAGKLAGKAFELAGKKLGVEAAKGAVKAAPSLINKASLLGKRVVQGAAGGATFGAATTAPTPEEYAKNIGANAKFGAAIPMALTGAGAAGGIVGKGLTKAGHFISEQIGGVTKATRETIARLGADRVFDPLKEQANYVGQVLVPKAQAKLSSSINKFTKNIEDVAVKQFKVPQAVVDDIKSFGVRGVRKTSETNANSTQGIVTKIQQGMDAKEEAAHTSYREAIKSFKGRDITADIFYRTIQASLRNKGWVDLRGNPTSRYKSGLNTTYDKLTDLYRDMKTRTSKGKEISGRLLSKEDFSTYRDILWDMIKERPSDIIIHKARYALYNAAEASGMKGIQAARDAERVVAEANKRFQTTRGELKGILSEPTLERFYKLSQQKVKSLRDLEKYTGVKIVDDIRQINAAKYLRDLEGKLLDPSGLEKDLHATGNPKASILKDAYKKLLGKNIMDDLDAHFANRDFRMVTDVPGTGGTIYPSRAGFLRTGIAGAAKKYYKDIKPAFIQGRKRLEGVGKKVGGYYQTPLSLSKQGQTMLQGKKGFAGFGSSDIKRLTPDELRLEFTEPRRFSIKQLQREFYRRVDDVFSEAEDEIISEKGYVGDSVDYRAWGRVLGLSDEVAEDFRYRFIEPSYFKGVGEAYVLPTLNSLKNSTKLSVGHFTSIVNQSSVGTLEREVLLESLRKWKKINTYVDTGELGTNAVDPETIWYLAKKIIDSNPRQYKSLIRSKRKGPDIFGKGGFTSFGGDVYTGEKELTTKILRKLEGRSTVSKQFISDLTNQPELKQAERDLIRQTLNEYGDTVSVKEFADKVKVQLLPLKLGSSLSSKELRGMDTSELSNREIYELQKSMKGWAPQYEGVVLPDGVRGPIASYFERIYESPIKTSAGDIHYGGSRSPQNYFAHTRIEDLPTKGNYTDFSSGKAVKGVAVSKEPTRRIIELQSDLFQKGNLKSSVSYGGSKKITTSEQNIKTLRLYENTWHERIIREEIKQAAKDGKTKLQFPTGETAMKIEGLGINQGEGWRLKDSSDIVNLSELKVGQELRRFDEKWIITDVLSDGKFRAIPKDAYEKQLHSIMDTAPYPSKAEALKRMERSSSIETFDISGKIDTNNPIYRFYEKEVARYLKRVAPDTKLITDKQGVTWYQMDVPKAAKNRPIEAFAAAGAPVLLAPRKKEQPRILEGEASTYGWGEKLNKDTFSGEEFNPEGITVAMRNVPMGTKVKVTDKKTGKTVVATVNDGGPAEKTKRVVDLSKGAWKALGYNKAGLAQVSVEILEEGKGNSYPRSKPSLIKSRK